MNNIETSNEFDNIKDMYISSSDSDFELIQMDFKYNNKLQQYIYLFKYFEDIQNKQIKKFNLILFKEDILSLENYEFDEIYNEIIDNILSVNEFNFELLLEKNSISFTKQEFIDFIDFYMFLLPYNFLKPIIVKFDSFPDFYEYLMNENTTIKKDIIENIILKIDSNKRFTEVISSVGYNINSEIKKEKHNTMLKLLNGAVESKEQLYNKYKDLIDDVNLEDLQNLISCYIENDKDNLKA